MPQLCRLDDNSNAYTVQFDVALLEPVREAYRRSIANTLASPRHAQLLAGGEQVDRPMPATRGAWYAFSYGKAPLLWISCNNAASYRLFHGFFDALGIEQQVRELVDVEHRVMVYCGFFVVGNHSPEPVWHEDYVPGANA